MPRKSDASQLCPRCKLADFLPSVRAKSYTRLPTIESSMKLCSKLRRHAEIMGIIDPCKHFPKTERINGWFGTLKKRRRK